MDYKSHTKEEILKAQKKGKTILRLDTDTGDDDMLIMENTETVADIKGDIMNHHESDHWPEKWSLEIVDYQLDEHSNPSLTGISDRAWDACCDGEWLAMEFPEVDYDPWDGDHDNQACAIEEWAQFSQVNELNENHEEQIDPAQFHLYDICRRVLYGDIKSVQEMGFYSITHRFREIYIQGHDEARRGFDYNWMRSETHIEECPEKKKSSMKKVAVDVQMLLEHIDADKVVCKMPDQIEVIFTS